MDSHKIQDHNVIIYLVCILEWKYLKFQTTPLPFRLFIRFIYLIITTLFTSPLT